MSDWQSSSPVSWLACHRVIRVWSCACFNPFHLSLSRHLTEGGPIPTADGHLEEPWIEHEGRKRSVLQAERHQNWIDILSATVHSGSCPLNPGHHTSRHVNMCQRDGLRHSFRHEPHGLLGKSLVVVMATGLQDNRLFDGMHGTRKKSGRQRDELGLSTKPSNLVFQPTQSEIYEFASFRQFQWMFPHESETPTENATENIQTHALAHTHKHNNKVKLAIRDASTNSPRTRQQLVVPEDFCVWLCGWFKVTTLPVACRTEKPPLTTSDVVLPK